MNAAHLHLILNHAPLFGVLFGALGLSYAFVRHSDDAARLSLGLVLLAGLLAVPTYLTGEEAEDVVEDLAGVSHDRIEEHEDAGKMAAIGAGLLGLVALGGLLGFRRTPVPRTFTLVALVLTLSAAGWIGYTANLGGQIRHTEIRVGTPAAGDEANPPRSHENED